MVDESGGPCVLQEADALAKGSIKDFLTGTSYKRYKTLQKTLAVALEALHFKVFLNQVEENEEFMLSTIVHELRAAEEKNHLYLKEIEGLFTKYADFWQETELGRTAQFWLQYVNYIHLYHDFSRSIKDGNLELFIRCLPKFTNIFFALDHPNYARWMVKFLRFYVKVRRNSS